MADQIDFSLVRATDGNNNPLAGAIAYFYEEGTTTPLAVYPTKADSIGSTNSLGTSVTADANGVFVPVWVNGTAAKVNMTTAAGAQVAGYPQDPARNIGSSAAAAATISFAPITGNAATNVQTAIANNTARLEDLGTPTAAGVAILTGANAAAQRTSLGLGSAAVAALIDDDSMATATAANIPSAESVVAYVDANDTNGASYVRVHTANGYGSSNTKIRRFTTIVDNVGSDITYADSAANGGSFTINTSGVYAGSYSDQFSSASQMGITKDSAELTTDFGSTTSAAAVLAAARPSANNAGANVSFIAFLAAGSVIRAHTEGVSSGTFTAAEQFQIVRIS